MKQKAPSTSVQYKRTTETKAYLLAAATSLFMNDACEPVTSRMVADRAQVNHALIAYHFGSFSTFMDCVFEKCIQELRQNLAPILEQFQKDVLAGVSSEWGIILRQNTKALFEILSKPDSTALFRAVTSANSRVITHAYARFSETVLEPVFTTFLLFVVKAKGRLEPDPETAVLAQVMLAQCMAFFRGAPLVNKQLGWATITNERQDIITTHVINALASAVGVK